MMDRLVVGWINGWMHFIAVCRMNEEITNIIYHTKTSCFRFDMSDFVTVFL